MKKLFSLGVALTALGFFFYLGIEFIRRALLDAPGDPLIPLMFCILIVMGSAIFQIAQEIHADTRDCREGMQEIKGAVVIFVSQSRTEAEYLQEVAKYYKTVEEIQQKPDLN